MKHFPFKILVLCILLPPLVYVVSLNRLESWLQGRYQAQIAAIYRGNTQSLLTGQTRLEDALAKNIDAFLKTLWLPRLGVRLQVMVVSGQGTIVYPSSAALSDDNPFSTDPVATANENRRLLNQGLHLDVAVAIGHDTLFSVSLLLLFVAVALIVLWRFYSLGVRAAQTEAQARQAEMERLRALQEDGSNRLNDLIAQRARLEGQLAQIREELSKEKSKAARNESDLIEELATLEQSLIERQTLQQQLEAQMAELQARLEQETAGQGKSERAKTKAETAIARRFEALYKQLIVGERAIKGFVDLPEEIKIKAEELLSQLNHSPDQVPVKRKVFSKKNSPTVLEAVFAYKGRLYFRRTGPNQIEVLAIGTKLTQTKDLAYLQTIEG
jgi:hypothetical protein